MHKSGMQYLLLNINWTMVIIILIPQIMPIVSQRINQKFTLNYFAEKKVQQISMFACWNNADILKYTKHIMKNTQMSYHAIEDIFNIRSFLKSDYYKIGVVLDFDCPGSQDILKQFSAANLLFNESYVWLTVTTLPEVPTIILRELPLRVDSEFVVALAYKDTYVLYDVYNYSYRHGGKLNITKMGFWKEESGLKNYLTQYKFKRRQNLHGITLNFSTILTNKPEPDLETYLAIPKDRHLDSVTRYHYGLVLHLRDIYNFSINLKLDTSWGYRNTNGTFNGIIGDMIKGTIDASACYFQQREERIGLVEYTVPTYGLKPHMFFRHPKKNTLRNQFLKPLEKNVWMLSLNISIVFWIFLIIVVKVDDYYQSHRDQMWLADASSDSTITIVAAISQQGSSIEPNLFSGRIAFLVLFVWSLMMFQFYSASIVGSLLAPPKRFINTLLDLADSDLEVGFEDIAWQRNAFATKDDPETVYFYKKKFYSVQKRKHWDHQKNGMLEVSKGGYAFSSETGSAYQIIEDTFTQEQICDVVEVPLIEPQYVSLIMSKYSPFKEMFIYGLRQMVQHGLVDHLKKVWTHRRPQCPESFRSQPLPIGLMEFSPALFLIVLGSVVATIILAVEKFLMISSQRKILKAEKVDSQSKSTTSLTTSQLEA
ncbi:ionotropic receptor 75a-like [Phymastichus coffea]|uniref:ionotropic receptor 75a-like n=1 Tax=Phymastichus coffea TaxID=108790 RepID=UPI00273AABDE|nr:ionotropic receptor 75a-like [Phymastichus coffea]